MNRRLVLAALLLAVAASRAEATPSSAEIVRDAPADAWRALDPENTLQMDLPTGPVLIELAPDFAPRHVTNLKALVRAGYFDGLAVMRVQDNYVAQWGDAEGQKPVVGAAKTLLPEFERLWSPSLPFTRLRDGDVYAPEVGFSSGFPAARDRRHGKAWLAHCYGMVGAGRDNAPDSGGGTELYAVIGHAPRHLDRNVTLLGRVVQGIERLSSLPRGTEALGFYATPEQRVPVIRVQVQADLAPEERIRLDALRTDTPIWSRFVEARRSRHESWFVEATGHIELCNVPLPVRAHLGP
jgi:peptidylprolyl isomerase